MWYLHRSTGEKRFMMQGGDRMKKMTPVSHHFLENIAEVFTQARKNAKAAVNLSMV